MEVIKVEDEEGKRSFGSGARDSKRKREPTAAHCYAVARPELPYGGRRARPSAATQLLSLVASTKRHGSLGAAAHSQGAVMHAPAPAHPGLLLSLTTMRYSRTWFWL